MAHTTAKAGSRATTKRAQATAPVVASARSAPRLRLCAVGGWRAYGRG